VVGLRVVNHSMANIRNPFGGELFQSWFKTHDNLMKFANQERQPDLIDGVLPAGQVVLLTGQPKSGKSLLAQHWAHAVASGNSWNGHAVEQGAVLYLNPDGEQPRYLLERFLALDAYTGVTTDFENGLRSSDSFAIPNSDNRQDIFQGLEYAGLRLVVIDTLAAASPGLDLNSQKDVETVSRFAKEITKRSKGQTSVLIVLHSPKTSSEEISGSTQIKAGASLVFSVVAPKNSDVRTVRVTDSRHTAGDYQAKFTVKSITLPSGATSGVLVAIESTDLRESGIRNDLGLKFDDYIKDEWILQQVWTKDLSSRLGYSDSKARRWLEKASEMGALEEQGKLKSRAFRIPNPHLSPNAPDEDSPLSPPSPTPLSVGTGDSYDKDELF
jgi:archaellum biogenesis ATPase FlaH